MLNSLFLHGKITTTQAKAKEIQPKAEKLITLGKKAQDLPDHEYLHNYRRALSILQDKKIVKKLFTDIVERFDQRNGGYTRILKLGGFRWESKGHGKVAFNRLGDNAKRVILELVELKDKDQELYAAGRGKLAQEEVKLEKRGKKQETKPKAKSKK